MARKLVVEIVGDASSLERTFQRSANGARKFDQQMTKTFRGTVAGTGAFRSLGRAVAFASGGFLAGFGLTSALRSVFEEMSKAQKVGAQTAAVIKSTGGVAGVSADHVQALADSLLNLTGIDDEVIKSGENMLLTFTNIRNVAGKNNDVFNQATVAGLDMATALEGAGFEGGNLQTTMIRLGKALNDPVKGVTALRRVGVQFTKSQQDQIKALVESGKTLEAQKLILREVRREFGGSAAAAGTTLAGKLGVLRETVRNVAADMLEKLLPAITKVVDRAVAWVKNLENQKRVMDDVRSVAKVVVTVYEGLAETFRELNTITGSLRNTLKLLLGVFIAYKALRIVSSFGLLAESMVGAKAGATGLRGVLAGRGGLIVAVGALSFALTTAIIHLTGFDKKLHDFGGAAFDALAKIHPFGLELDPTAQFAGTELLTAKAVRSLRRQANRLKAEGLSAQQAADELVRTHARLAVRDAQVIAGVFATARPLARATDAVMNAILAARKRARKIVRDNRAEAPGDVSNRAAIAARLRASREAARQEAVDRAELAVDRTALTKSVADDIAALNKLNALLKRRIKGGHDTIAIEQQQLQVQLQLNGLLEQQAEQAKEAAKARRDARQFRLLGFGPTGEDIIPGVKGLKRQLAAVNDAIAGSFLDTRKTRGLIAHIRQVLAGGLGSVSSEVRARIKEILDDLRQQLKQSSVDVTKFQQSARGQLTLAGAHPGGQTVVVNGGVHLHGVQNVAQMENELAKRSKQRAHARRATR